MSTQPSLTPAPAAPIVVVVPGFLTETTPLLPERLDPLRAVDGRAWRDELTRVIPPRAAARVEVFSWSSEAISTLLIKIIAPFLKGPKDLSRLAPKALLQIATQSKSAWHRAEEEADGSASRLALHLRDLRAANPHAPIYVIGHSLGGRMALRACALMAEERAPIPELHVSAWAPAIDTKEVPWEQLAALPLPPEVVYSGADQVLKTLFRLATSTLTGVPLIDVPTALAALALGPDAAGLVGPPEGRYPRELCTDVSGEHIGHLAYLSELPTLLKGSPRLRPLSP